MKSLQLNIEKENILYAMFCSNFKDKMDIFLVDLNTAKGTNRIS